MNTEVYSILNPTEVTEFGKATDLIKAIQEQIAIHGKDLRVAFFGESIQVDHVELTNPPRLDLIWKHSNRLSNEQIREAIDEQWRSEHEL